MDDSKPATAIIGTGALGTALARRLAECGYPVEAVLSRTVSRARALADNVEASVASDSLHDVPGDVRLVFCCVPDDAVGVVAQALGRTRRDWSGCTVAHTSGALTAAALYGLGEQGAALLSFHPLQTFAPASPPDAFDGIYIGLEGDSAAVALGSNIAIDLGARPLTLTPYAKVRYHLAASMASNYLVTLMGLVGEVLSSIDLDRQQGAALMRPLVEGTWRNLARHLPEDVLSGPIARGDRQTIAGHLEALNEHLPHLIPVYAALGAETVRVAVRGGKLAPDEAQQILNALHTALEPYTDYPY
ncbi:MAG: Rossmann-like and DUF2520 domain-containing protein [Rhodothermales bacterium]